MKSSYRPAGGIPYCVALSLAVLGACACVARGGSFAVMSTSLGMTNQAGWQLWYNTSDSPEGAFLGTIRANASGPLTGTIKLNRTIAAGRYNVFFKIYDYKAGGRMDFTLGGATAAPASLEAADFNKWWTPPATVTSTAPASTMSITVYRTKALSVAQLYLLKGIYVTTEAGEVVFADDSVLDLTYPPLDTTAPLKGNLLSNSGFEAGPGHGWGTQEFHDRAEPLRAFWTETAAYEGAASMRIPNGEQLVSRSVRLRSHREHTFSAWVKGSDAGTATLVMEGVAVPDFPTNYPLPVAISQSFVINSGWKRVSVSGVLPTYPTGDYHLRVYGSDPGGCIFVDALQFEEGPLAAYAPRQRVEAGLVSDQPNSLFYDDEACIMRLRVHNGGTNAAAVSVLYVLYDYLNRPVGTGSRNLSVASRATADEDLDLTPGRRGLFRAALWISGLDHSLEEVLFGVVPRPQEAGLDPASLMGIHAGLTDLQCGALRQLGIKWNRMSSPSLAFRWSAVEPADGVFAWTTEPIGLASAYGVSLLGTIGIETPAWAIAGGLPDLAKWERFVETVVGHYGSQVAVWEIWNEPNWDFTPELYAEMLRRACGAARRADPNAQIVGLGGVSTLAWATNALNALGVDSSNLLAISTHIYPKNKVADYAAFKSNVVDRYGLPAWNTEAGAWDSGAYVGDNAGFIEADGYIWPHTASERFEVGCRGGAQLLAYGFLNNVGNGLEKYMSYDGRLAVGPASHAKQPTIFEYDDSVRAKGIVFSVLAKYLDHAVGLGNISPATNSIIYLFDRGGAPVLGAWGTDGRNHTLLPALAPAQYRAFDMMGNAVALDPAGAVPYSHEPVLIEGVGVSADAMRSAVQAGWVATVADTNPPSLALVVFPTGPTYDDPVKFRWFAMDELCEPSPITPNAIQFSFMLAGRDAAWSDWSPASFVNYTNLSPGAYEFQVMARDSAGNVSGAVRMPLQVVVRPPDTPLPPPPEPDFPEATAMYRLDSSSGITVFDSSRNQLDGTLVGAAGWGPGVFSNALVLNGADAYASVPSSPAFDIGRTNSVTVTAWVKSAPGAPATRMLVSRQRSVSQAGFALMQLNMSNSYFYVRLVDADGDKTGYLANRNGPYINDGQWHHVAMVIDRSNQSLLLYTDGIASAPYDLAAVGADGIGDIVNTAAFTIGGAIYKYAGSVDDVRVYRKALTAAQLDDIRNGLQPPPEVTFPAATALYRLDAGSGTAVADSSTNLLDGTLVGGASWGPGVFSNALVLNGVNAYASVPSSPAFDIGRTNSVTVTAWVKSAPGAPATRMLVSRQRSVSQAGFALMQLNMSNSYFYVRLVDADGDKTGYLANRNGPYINDGQWHHVAMVIDRSNQSLLLYTDGIASAPYDLAAVGVDGIGDIVNTAAFTIGGAIYKYAGSVDDVRVYRLALTSAQLDDIRNGLQ